MVENHNNTINGCYKSTNKKWWLQEWYSNLQLVFSKASFKLTCGWGKAKLPDSQGRVLVQAGALSSKLDCTFMFYALVAYVFALLEIFFSLGKHNQQET